MLHAVAIWLLVAAFAGAGLINAIGTPALRSDFVRWGYPPWWRHVTGGLELVTAVLLALSGSRQVGLMLGAAIVVAAILTVLRHRDFAHLVPLGVFAALLALAVLQRSGPP